MPYPKIVPKDRVCAVCNRSYNRKRDADGNICDELKVFRRRKTCHNKQCHYTSVAMSRMKKGCQTAQGYINRLQKLLCKVMCNRCQTRDDLLFHHINRDNTDNSMNNIEVLCRSCHMAEHKHDREDTHFRVNFGDCTHCDRKAIGKGMCAMHLRRFNRHGTADKISPLQIGHVVAHDPAPDRKKPRGPRYVAIDLLGLKKLIKRKPKGPKRFVVRAPRLF